MYTDLDKPNNNFFGNLFRKRKKRLFDDFEKKFNQTLLIHMAFGLVFILLGLVFVQFISIPENLIHIFLGIIILGWSVNAFLTYRKSEYKIFNRYIFYSIIGLILAILFFVFKSPNTIFACFVLLSAVTVIDYALMFKKIQNGAWTVLAVSTILMILLAVVLFIYPLEHLLMIQFMGVLQILYGMLNIMVLNLVKNTAVDHLNDF